MKTNTRQKIIYLAVVFMSCVDPSGALNNNNLEYSEGDAKKVAKIVSGRYSDVSLAIQNGILTGVYEYYDGWSEEYREYTQTCVFYLVGNYTNRDSLVSINVGWPTHTQRIRGEMTITEKSQTIGLLLNDQPYGYSAVDFTILNEYKSHLTEEKDWLQIRIVKSDKARLFSSPDVSKIKKSYIVKYDIVKVLAIENKWYFIEYSSKGNDDKSINAWIQEDDLYNINPEYW